MIHNNSLLQTSHELLAPEVIQKVAIITGDSFKKVREALTSIVPIFTSKILEQGATLEGASHLIEVVKTDSEKAEVEKISHEIFTDPTSEKILNVIGPTLFSPIRQKVYGERLSAYGLMRYFQLEKDYAAGMNPERSEYYQLSGEDPFKDSTMYLTGTMPWYGLSFLMLMVAISSIVLWLDKVLI